MAEKTQSINLLPNRGNGFVDQFLGWALTIGRLLIILTETLALSVFFYRFSLDMKISDLHDQIKIQRAIVSQFKTTEDASRNVQARLALAQKSDLSGKIIPSALSDIVNLGKGKITFKTLEISADAVKIEAQAPSSSSLNAFVNGLKQYPGVKDVNIDSVENKTTSAVIKLTISAQLKNAVPIDNQPPAGNTPGIIPVDTNP